jgi:hypothetical protein
MDTNKAIEILSGYNRNTIISTIYDKGNVSEAFLCLMPDFEYPSWSWRILGDFLRITTPRTQTVKIFRDHHSISPRESDNLGTMVCFHKRYNFGDLHKFSSIEYQSRMDDPDVFVLPLYMYDHSSQHIATTPFSCPWDSGQLGWIEVTREDALKMIGPKNMTPDNIMHLLKMEVIEYNSYINGDVYRFEIHDENGEEVDSCGSFYGQEWHENGLIDHIPEACHKQLKDIEIIES